MAEIGWIDFSPEYKEKVGTILDHLKPEGVVDELGISTIRDSISNLLFPGISTIQTRAKYFFIVPYILYDYLRSGKSKKKNVPAVKYLVDIEHQIMWDLSEYYGHMEGVGVIGITKKRGEPILRRPSEIYWGGLNTYKLIDSLGLGVNGFLSLSSKDSFESLISTISERDDQLGDDKDADFENTFNLSVLTPDLNWQDELTLDLSYNEADFLKNKILDTVGNRLVGQILTNSKLQSLFMETDDFMHFSKLAVNKLDLESRLKDQIIVAHDFSEMIYGVHIVYNYLLQKKRFGKEYFYDDWIKWFNSLKSEMIDYKNFKPEILFGYPYSQTTKIYTQRFVIENWNLIKKGVDNIDRYTDLVINQEYSSKRHKSRIRNDKLDDIREEHWMGLKRLSYRYGNARVILGDIIRGLENA